MKTVEELDKIIATAQAEKARLLAQDEYPKKPGKGEEHWVCTCMGPRRIYSFYQPVTDNHFASGLAALTEEECERIGRKIALYRQTQPMPSETTAGHLAFADGTTMLASCDPAAPGDRALVETGRWFPKDKEAEARAHAQALKDFHSEGVTK